MWQEIVSRKEKEIARLEQDLKTLREREAELEQKERENDEAKRLGADAGATPSGSLDSEIELEREKLSALKEDYEQRLSLLGEREYELNQLEAELEEKKKRTEEISGGGQDSRFQINSLLEKGKAMAATGQNLQAYFFFRLAVYIDPHHPSALNNLAISMYKLGFKDKAETCIRKVLELEPENEAARINLERMQKSKTQ